MANKKIPTPKADPRGYGHMQGSPSDVDEHPTDSGHNDNHYKGEQLIKDLTTSYGPKAIYRAETRQMQDSVDTSERLRKDD